MTQRERLALAALVGALVLLAGIQDLGDPTPALIRLPIVGLGAVGLAWVVWRWSG